MDCVEIIEPTRARKDRRFKDMIGQVFGYWTVIGYAGSKGGATWLCRCHCGIEKVVTGDTLRRGRSESCGCRPYSRNTPVKHGKTRTAEHNVWVGMKKRCHNPSCDAYPHYGGRGIKVCDRWLESFAAFLEDVGPRPSPQHTIDRIDGNGDYSPENCCWATKKEQANHTRRNYALTALGRTLNLRQWQDETGIGWSTIKRRLGLGWHPDAAVTIPVGTKRGTNCGNASASQSSGSLPAEEGEGG